MSKVWDHMCVTLLKLECMFCTNPKNVLLLAIVLYLLLYQEAIKTLFILSYLILSYLILIIYLCPAISVIAPSMSHLTSKQVLKSFISTPTWSYPSMPRYLGLTSLHLPRFTCIPQPHPDHVSLPCRFLRSCNLHFSSIQVHILATQHHSGHISPQSRSRALYLHPI